MASPPTARLSKTPSPSPGEYEAQAGVVTSGRGAGSTAGDPQPARRLGSLPNFGLRDDPYVASALALSWSYSAWVIAPESKSSLPLAISSVGPDVATDRT